MSGLVFWRTKRVLDVAASVVLLPILGCVAMLLLLLNPFLNRGPLLFRQARMGRGGAAFEMIKFRTMLPCGLARGADDPLEEHRITPLGFWLRRTRIDELPQIVNILQGDMSLIGPRPDCVDHARQFVSVVPHYRDRYGVRPGISGFAQVQLGYTEGQELARRKTQLDLYYIENASWRLDLRILLATLRVILTGQGAR